MCLALGTDGLDRRALLGLIARLGGSAAALTTLGPVVWAQTDPPLPAEVAGVKLPLSALVLKAAREVFADSEPVIYFHSVRTFVLASLYADQEKWTFNRELVMLSSLFHDIGLTKKQEERGRSFLEVSADRAREFVVREGGFSDRDARLVHRGIALHFDPPSQSEPEVRLIAIGTSIDLFSRVFDRFDFPTQGEIDRIAAALPRHRFKTAFLEEQREHVRRTEDPGPIKEWLDSNPGQRIAASRWPE